MALLGKRVTLYGHFFLSCFSKHPRLYPCSDIGFMLQGPEGPPGPQGPKGAQVRVATSLSSGFVLY